jgi:hypothetical protein
MRSGAVDATRERGREKSGANKIKEKKFFDVYGVKMKRQVNSLGSGTFHFLLLFVYFGGTGGGGGVRAAGWRAASLRNKSQSPLYKREF